jgi:hypothetical protein
MGSHQPQRAGVWTQKEERGTQGCGPNQEGGQQPCKRQEPQWHQQGQLEKLTSHTHQCGPASMPQSKPASLLADGTAEY